MPPTATDPDAENRSQSRRAPLKILTKASLSGWSSTWEILWDGYPQLPQRLAAAGIDGVEVALRMTGDRDEDAATMNALLSWAPPWHGAGLVVYVHPYTHGPANPAAYVPGSDATAHDAFQLAADAAAQLTAAAGKPIILTYHAAEGKDVGPGDREELLKRSVAFFAAADRYLERLGAPVTVVSETQLPYHRHEPHVRIGDRPEEVLATAAGREHVGVCWDSGHYLLAVERVDVSPEPAAEFAAAVVHMHIHDVAGGVDHRPLGPASQQVAGYVAQAAAAGQLGSITLEFNYALAYPDQTPSAAQLLDYLETTAVMVRDWARDA